MENATRALTIGASTILGVLIFAVAIFFIRMTGLLPTEKQIELEAQQIAAFNNEYTAYDKRIMYGVDVLSCLNKARSNNEKYVSGSFISGDLYTKQYIIDVAFRIKTPLEDEIRISYLRKPKSADAIGTFFSGESDGRLNSIEYEYETGKGPNVPGSHYSKTKLSGGKYGIFKEPSTNYVSIIAGASNSNPAKNLQTRFQGTESVVTDSYTSKMGPTPSGGFNTVSDGFYHLLAHPKSVSVNGYSDLNGLPSDPKTNDSMAVFLDAASEMSQVVKNTSSDMEDKIFDWYTEKSGGTVDKRGWSTAEWRNALYDFKKRKFTCNAVIYDAGSSTYNGASSEAVGTGRIICLVFSEYGL